jgi:hypothetical protein
VFVHKRRYVRPTTEPEHRACFTAAAESQEDVISPKLFTAALENAFKVLDWKGRGININGEYITQLRFADDIVVMAETMEDHSAMLADLCRASDRVSLKMNMDKTKIMFNIYVAPTPVIIGSSALEGVDDYVYLAQLGEKGYSSNPTRLGSIREASS